MWEFGCGVDGNKNIGMWVGKNKKNGGWVGWFQPVNGQNKLKNKMVKLGVCRPQKHPFISQFEYYRDGKITAYFGRKDALLV
jgi:hypothetical protein